MPAWVRRERSIATARPKSPIFAVPSSVRPDVPRLQVSVHDALGVGELQAPARLHGYVHDLVQRDTMVGSAIDNAFDIATAHELGDHVGLAFMVSQVEDGDDVGV